MARKPDPGARDRILDVATRLFLEHGVRAVGLQQIIDECGCGKNMLYREFASKDDLVVAYLERCRRDWDAIIGKAARQSPSPAEQLVTIVAAVAEQAVEPQFRGCPLRNAHSDFPERHPAQLVITAHYTDRQAHLRDLAARARAHDPETLANRIALIVDGLNGNGAVLGKNGAAAAAVAFAKDAVRAATT
jgi:AcrR family transcriptional regulator